MEFWIGLIIGLVGGFGGALAAGLAVSSGRSDAEALRLFNEMQSGKCACGTELDADGPV